MAFMLRTERRVQGRAGDDMTFNNYSTRARWISVGYNYLISNECQWNTSGMTQTASVLNSGAHSFRIFLESQILPCFFNFPVSRARPEILCNYYWLQLRITCKSGWIAQAKKKILCQQRRESKLTAQRRTKTQGCALMEQDLPSGD